MWAWNPGSLNPQCQLLTTIYTAPLFGGVHVSGPCAVCLGVVVHLGILGSCRAPTDSKTFPSIVRLIPELWDLWRGRCFIYGLEAEVLTLALCGKASIVGQLCMLCAEPPL